MDLDEIMMWTRAERHGVANFLDDLDDHEWTADSLCPGWTVHDVLAHLTLSNRVTLGGDARRSRPGARQLEPDDRADGA
ncbi:maleylpyruvate isomerase family mycothiol-dependent enzyme [Nocardia asiatica]|uniref:maleylpyruvate isomerase family mycothiol-dependent enzyme n=1 Tax=Nocardia asiatica TaxID=209252 RepID=UPI003EE2330F